MIASADPERHVLIVDDDLLSGRALGRDFTARGYEAEFVSSFDEAVKRVTRRPPELVVMDCSLNTHSALGVLRGWKQTAAAMHVIFLSASPSLSLAVEAMREGAIGFCGKPATAGTILDELQLRTAARPLAPAGSLQPTGLRLCSSALQPHGVDRFFALSHGLLCILGFDGYFKCLNRAWIAALGHTLEALCAVPWLDFVHPDDRARTSDETLQICEGELTFYFRNRFRCANGAYKWLAWNASPCPSEQLIYASAMDVTQSVDAEKRLSHTANRLREVAEQRAEKLDTAERTNATLLDQQRFKDEMSNLLVHDLKSPLSVIIANHDFILEELAGSPECLEALLDSQNASRRMMRLLANLLDVTRLEENRLAVALAPTNVSRLLEGIAAQRKVIAASRRVTLVERVAQDIVLEVDADLLTRTVENIVDNALRYTPSGGRIELDLRDAGGLIQFRIGNTGAAVPEAERARMFEKDSRDPRDSTQYSLGLRLYFCRLATAVQGGRIWVEETESLRTVFVIQLPRPGTMTSTRALSSSA